MRSPSSQPRRWTLHPCPECDNAEECSCGLQQCGHHGDRPDVEVMPVSEHERLRAAIGLIASLTEGSWRHEQIHAIALKALTEGAPE